MPETGVIVETSSLIKKGSKPKREELPEFVEFRKKLTDFQNSYAEPTKTGHIIENLKSIRQLFDLARGDGDICIEMHYSQQTEAWRKGRVDWIAVLRNFNFYLANRKGEQNGIIQNNSGYRETDRQQRDREAKQRNETFGELDRILAERDRILQGESGSNHQ